MVPFIFMIFLKGVLLFEFDTKQRYIKDTVDSIAYKVKITGVLTTDEYNELNSRLNKLSEFDGSGIVLKKGRYVNGALADWTNYYANTKLYKGEAFLVYVKSKKVSSYSKLQNGGVHPDDSQNLYYSAKAQCRIEYDE